MVLVTPRMGLCGVTQALELSHIHYYTIAVGALYGFSVNRRAGGEERLQVGK